MNWLSNLYWTCMMLLFYLLPLLAVLLRVFLWGLVGLAIVLVLTWILTH